MNYRAIAIDDEQFALDDLALIIRDIPNLELVEGFRTFGAAMDFLQVNGPVDVIFSDLDLEGKGDADDLLGLQVARELKEWCLLFYFFTGHPAYRIPAIDTMAAGHLLKPVDPEKIKEGLRWIERVRAKPVALSQKIHIRTLDRRVWWVDLHDICCLTTVPDARNHLKVVLNDNSELTMLASLSAMGKRIAKSGLFIQVSQSAIVAKASIRSSYQNMVKVASGHIFPVGKTHKQEFYRYYNSLG